MNPVVTQITEALIAIVGAIPELGGRAYNRGLVGWDDRSYPFAVVTAAKTSVETQRSGTGQRAGRVQDRTTQLVIEIHDLETEGGDYVARISALAAAVEREAPSVLTALPLDDLTLIADTGVTQIRSDEDGVRSAIALTFSATYLTVEGRPTEFVEPNY